MTSSLHGKHAEDFARRPGQERGPVKGNMPDETSSDNDQSHEENENSRSGEHMISEERNIVEMNDLHESGGQISGS